MEFFVVCKNAGLRWMRARQQRNTSSTQLFVCGTTIRCTLLNLCQSTRDENYYNEAQFFNFLYFLLLLLLSVISYLIHSICLAHTFYRSYICHKRLFAQCFAAIVRIKWNENVCCTQFPILYKSSNINFPFYCNLLVVP